MRTTIFKKLNAHTAPADTENQVSHLKNLLSDLFLFIETDEIEEMLHDLLHQYINPGFTLLPNPGETSDLIFNVRIISNLLHRLEEIHNKFEEGNARGPVSPPYKERWVKNVKAMRLNSPCLTKIAPTDRMGYLMIHQ